MKKLKIFFTALLMISFCMDCPAQEINTQDKIAQEQSKPEEAVPEVPQVSKGLRNYYRKIVTRDVLTDEDCKILIDLNQSIALIQKYYKEKRYDRAEELVDILFDEIVATKDTIEKRIDKYLVQGYELKDFKNLYHTIKRRRYPAVCNYRHLHNIENDCTVYERDIEKAIFKQEQRLKDKAREVKMREHIMKALELLEDKQYYQGRYQLRLALELCEDFETSKVLKQRIKEVTETIKYEKRQRALRRRQE